MSPEVSPHPAGRPESSSTGLDPRFAAALAYAAWWLTGLLFVAAERRSRYVRFHAFQAVFGFGFLFLVSLLLLVAAFASLLYSAAAFRVLLGVVYFAVLPISGFLWVAAVVQAFRGRRWRIPLAGRLAERFAGSDPG
jgi:uncharacterized membrane protein